MALSKTTRDHDEIRKWAESRGAVPAEVAGTAAGEGAGIFRPEFLKSTDQDDSTSATAEADLEDEDLDDEDDLEEEDEELDDEDDLEEADDADDLDDEGEPL